MRSLSEAEKHWRRLDQYHSLTELKIAVSSHDEPQVTAGLRSVCWKIFLLLKTLDRSTWPTKLHDSRTTYSNYRSHYLRAIEHPDEFDSSVDPLSENDESPWVALRADEALRAEIFQDIERCMPDNVYFRQPATQNMMLDILFIWCKLYPDVGYRQGMHEILAPILWVIERDAVDLHAVGGQEGDTDFGAMMDSGYIEHDSFTLFLAVMKTAKSFYAPAQTGSTTKDTPMLIRSTRIFDELLPKVDPALSAHLVKLEIVPQIFLLRWIRLLFGREFTLDSVLNMWDALFAIDSTLELVDMISIAMLLRIRWDLITADTNEAFTLLLRYPTPESPAYTFIKDALYLRDHLTPSGGAEIITRYGKKAPPIEQPPPPKAADIRAPSPSPSFVSSRTRHTIGSPKPFGSQQSGGGVGGLESLLQNAAKGVLDRGSQWSVGKAIRDAVGEVKKNVEAYQSGAATPSLSSGQTTPRSGGREFRKPARIATGGVVSHISGGGALSSNAIKKMESLERRNKQLARMLEGAVSELWEYHRERSEVAKEKKEEVEALSLAIAKVQFVQVYLEDSEIPLPMDENTAAEKDKEGEKVGTSGVTSPAGISTPKVRSPGPIARTASAPPPASPAAQSSKMAASSPGLLSPNSHLLTPNASTPRSPTSSSDLQHQQTSTRPRPHLASSSFSWMLGQDPDDAPRHTFAKASEHSSLASDEKRRMRGSISAGKGFLFGEEEEVGAEGGEGRRGSMAKKKGKGKGKKGEAVGEEVIGLDDVEVGLSGRKAEEEESAA